MHRRVYEFYKPLGLYWRPYRACTLQPQACGFLKFVDSVVHTYSITSISQLRKSLIQCTYFISGLAE